MLSNAEIDLKIRRILGDSYDSEIAIQLGNFVAQVQYDAEQIGYNRGETIGFQEGYDDAQLQYGD